MTEAQPAELTISQPLSSWLGDLFFVACLIVAGALGSIFFALLLAFPFFMLGEFLPPSLAWSETILRQLSWVVPLTAVLIIWWSILSALRVAASRTLRITASHLVFGTLLPVRLPYEMVDHIHARTTSPRQQNLGLKAPVGLQPNPNVELRAGRIQKLLFPGEHTESLLGILSARCLAATRIGLDGDLLPAASGWTPAVRAKAAARELRRTWIYGLAGIFFLVSTGYGGLHGKEGSELVMGLVAGLFALTLAARGLRQALRIGRARGQEVIEAENEGG